MNETGFRNWLERQGNVPASASTRLSDARRIERLFGDLDDAYDADKVATILATLAYSTADQQAGKPSPPGLEINGNVYESLGSYRAAVSAYVKFREDVGDRPALSQADRIREFVLKQYADPARQRGDAGFNVRAGDVHRGMGLENAFPAVCSALDSKKFGSLAQVDLTNRQGPANSSTVEFTFTFVDVNSFDIASAEAELRRRYGEPMKVTKKLTAHDLPNGRQIALLRDVARVELWIETQPGELPSQVQVLTNYGPDDPRHSNLPQRLRHAPSGGAAPRPVSLIHARNLQELRVLLDWYEGGALNREALSRYRDAFLAHFPDFLPGAFAKMDGKYVDEERRYKDEIMSLVDRALEAENEPEQLGARLLDIVAGVGDSPSNLLGDWRLVPRLNEIRQAHPGVLEKECAKLARSDDPSEGIAEFLEVVWPLLAEGQRSKPYSASRGIPTMLAALVHPDRAMGINSGRVQRLAEAVTGKKLFGYNPLSREEYASVLSFVMELRKIMYEEWGWQTKDLWDVQSFIWVVGKRDAVDAPEDDDEEEGLTRETVLEAMAECDRMTVDTFLESYRFSNPRRYWISESGRRYPCKAVANVAHKYLPDGQVASLGGSRAKKIIQDLGFDVLDTLEPVSVPPTNLILYGPPGTGKTYQTAREAVLLCDGSAPEDRDELMERYSALVKSGRIEFVTFHQSYSYEEFVEGLRPVTDGDGAEAAGFSLRPHPGIFRRIVRRAESSGGVEASEFSLTGRQVFKMSIGEAANPEDAHLFDEAIEMGYAFLGFADIDWTDDRYEQRTEMIEAYKREQPDRDPPTTLSGRVQCPFMFRNELREGDVIIVSKGNTLFRAIGEITGGYEYAPRDSGGYAHRRAVRWLWHDRAGVPVDEIYARGFIQKTIYKLAPSELNVPALQRYVTSRASASNRHPQAFVLIIDEINRANISKVFGELITLIEPDKRIGAENELRVRLPYSRETFGIPANLHLIGTMNTADRSIALLDTALRRRFTFREMMPDVATLVDASTRSGVDLCALLRTLNERIEYLFDREHQIGHAYFINCSSVGDVHDVMRNKIIPLLAEYFYEDWGKVALVLGDSNGDGRFLIRDELVPPAGFDNNGYGQPRYRWSVRERFADDTYSLFA